MKPSGMCLHIYSLPLSAFLKYQISGFDCAWSKFHPLVDIQACTLCKVSLSSLCFSAKYWTGHRYFIHKLEWYWALASKKKSIPDWHLFITQMETKWTKWYAMTSHVLAYRLSELLFGTHTFHFNCSLRILIAYLCKYAAYLGCCLCMFRINFIGCSTLK